MQHGVMPDIDEARRVYGEVKRVFDPPPPKPLIEVLREFKRWLEDYARPHLPEDDFERIMDEVAGLEMRLDMATVVTNLISSSLRLPDQGVFKSSSGVATMRQHSYE